MSFFGKEYKFERHENFEEFLRSVGVPEEKVKALGSYKSSQTVVKNADGTYTTTTTHGTKSTESTFTPGVEFDDTIGDDKVPIKTTYTIDGNTITQVIKDDKNRVATFKKEFNGDELVVTITSDSLDGVAKRYYKA